MRSPVRVFPSLHVVVLIRVGPSVQAQPDALAVQDVTITVTDLDRAVPFYRDALSKEKNSTSYQKTLGLNNFYLEGDEVGSPLGPIQMLWMLWRLARALGLHSLQRPPLPCSALPFPLSQTTHGHRPRC